MLFNLHKIINRLLTERMILQLLNKLLKTVIQIVIISLPLIAAVTTN